MQLLSSGDWPSSRGPILALGVFLLLACTPIREDEFQCEEAVGHLMECCPGFGVPESYCTYDPGGGCEGPPPTYPALSTDRSQCIRAENCHDLVSSGVGARAAAVAAGPSYADGVCP